MALMKDSSGESVFSRARRLLGRGKSGEGAEGAEGAPRNPAPADDDATTEILGDLIHKDIDEADAADREAQARPTLAEPDNAVPRPQPITSPELGEILWLDDGSVIIYRQPVPNKKYDFVYQLCDGGALEARAIVAEYYRPRSLGRLDVQLFRQLIREKRWTRDAILYHLDHWSFGKYLPTSNGSRPSEPSGAGGELETLAPVRKPVAVARPAATSRPSAIIRPVPSASREEEEEPVYEIDDDKPEPEEEESALRRGARVTILNGSHAWDAIYWANDARGDILAHRTGNFWQLTRIDLKRFGNKVKIGAPLSNEEITSIAEELLISE